MIASLENPSPLEQWRHRLGGRRHRDQPRPLAALGYLADGPVLDGLVEVENLTVILLCDEPLRRGPCALRLAGYCGSRVPWGVRFGGPKNCRFFKDLRLQPVPGGQGYRLDLANAELLRLGLQLDRQIDRHVRYPNLPVRPQIQLPKLWAAFRPADAASITGGGPELEAYCRRTGRPAQHLLQRLRREHHGLVLFPHSWTSHHWQQALAVFADLERFPKRQVFRLRHLPHDLIGYQDATEFDFHGRPQRAGNGRRRRHAGHPAPVVATM